MRSGIGVRDRPGRYPRARKGETMSVSIATITAVLIVGHIVVFLLLLFDTRQGVVTGYDRAFLWGKALQIAGWVLMMAASSTGLIVLFRAGNATLKVRGAIFLPIRERNSRKLSRSTAGTISKSI